MATEQPTEQQLARIRARLISALSMVLDELGIDYESCSVTAAIKLPSPPIEIKFDHKPNRG